MSKKTEFPDHIINDISELSDRVIDIVVELRCRTYHGDSVQIKGVLIKTRSCHYRILKKALQRENTNMFGGAYKIISKEMHKTMTKYNGSGFDYLLLSHNHFVNKFWAIPINFLPIGFCTMKVCVEEDGFPAQSISVPLQKFLVDTCKAISIKETKDTAENGSHQIILSNDDYRNSTNHLCCLFKAFKTNSKHEVTKATKGKW